MIFGEKEKVLEVGGGDRPIYRPNLDVRKLASVDIVADLSKPWPVPDASYQGVYSAYVMEHISWREVAVFVGEIFRALEPGGRALVITSNTEAQMRWALEQGSAYDKVAQCLFGDLDYPENSHRSAFNPTYALKLFRQAGFRDVMVAPWGELKTDLMIEARKPMTVEIQKPEGGPVMDAGAWTPEERKEAYNRHYFDGGRGKVGGYSREGYWDYPVHHLTAEKILALKPESVLELGCARGYVLKRLEDAGVHCVGFEVSDHCRLTRVTDAVRTFDITQTPWPFQDKAFDLSFSIAVLEHIPAAAIERVVAEIRRVSRRGLHGVDFGEHDDGFDKTHCLLREKPWWDLVMNPKGIDQDGQVVVDKEDLERGAIPIPKGDAAETRKLNCGSFKTMFHHGWVNMDVADLEAWAKNYGYDFFRQDLRRGFPYGEATAHLIYTSHFLEHLTYQDGLAFLKEARRVLTPGGIIRVGVPDARRLLIRYVNGGLSEFDEISDNAAANKTDSRKLWELLMSGHLAIYDEQSLGEQLWEAGFSSVKKMPFGQSDSKIMKRETYDMFPDFSLYMEAKR